MPKKPLIPVIAGPTAGGKTELAIACAKLAKERGLVPQGKSEVISADAFQIYRGLDIASGKPTMDERQGVPHHAIDIVEPSEPFTVAQWLELATNAIDDIEARGGWPIIAGGTHLYIKALIDGLFEGPPADEALRDQLRAVPPAELRAELERIDPKAAERIHPADQRRTIRAVEVFRLTGTPISEHQSQWDRDTNPLADRLLLVTLQWETEAINRRINARVRSMVEAGLVEETRRLLESGNLGVQAAQALGTKQILEHIRPPGSSGLSLDDAIERVKIETRRFAKNQRTWLRRLASGPAHRPHRLAVYPDRDDIQESMQIIVDTCFMAS
ncbi:MAG: tRNA (adenosine(37)-N6)-dimethylallyltransferase MiaA [Phycisphaerales bacterium]|nr:tRNA (adenosine(37)-N6)-dimethylallyltransferase MiaA [Phycisphaerales bacterium]